MIKNLFKCEKNGRMTGDERREQILQSAVELFSKYGFSGTTTKKIAEASGVSEAMVFRHFSTKDELYGAILHSRACRSSGRSEDGKFPCEHNERVSEAMEKRDDRAFFYHMALQALYDHEENVEFMRLLFYSALEGHELADRFFSEFVSQGYEFIGNYIAQRQSEGAMRNVNPTIVVRAFIGMLIHHSLNNILWDKCRRLLNISNEEAAENFAEIILHGVSK